MSDQAYKQIRVYAIASTQQFNILRLIRMCGERNLMLILTCSLTLSQGISMGGRMTVASSSAVVTAASATSDMRIAVVPVAAVALLKARPRLAGDTLHFVASDNKNHYKVQLRTQKE